MKLIRDWLRRERICLRFWSPGKLHRKALGQSSRWIELPVGSLRHLTAGARYNPTSQQRSSTERVQGIWFCRPVCLSDMLHWRLFYAYRLYLESKILQKRISSLFSQVYMAKCFSLRLCMSTCVWLSVHITYVAYEPIRPTRFRGMFWVGWSVSLHRMYSIIDKKSADISWIRYKDGTATLPSRGKVGLSFLHDSHVENYTKLVPVSGDFHLESRSDKSFSLSPLI